MLNLSTDQILNFNTLPTKCTEMTGDGGLPEDPAEFTLCIVPLDTVNSVSGGNYTAPCHVATSFADQSRYLAANWNTAVRLHTSASRMSPDQMMRGSPQSCPDGHPHDSPAVSPLPAPSPRCLGSPAFSDISTDSPQTSSALSGADTVPCLDSVVHSVVPHTPPSSSEEWDELELELGGLDTYGAIPSHAALPSPSPSPSATTPASSEGYDEEEAENELVFYRNLELGTEEGVHAHVSMILAQFDRGIMPDITPKTAENTQSATPYTDVVENKKKPKDGKVKRPMNSFFTFSRVYRRKIIGSRPNGVHNNIISSHLGRVWKSPLFEQHFKDYFKHGAQHMKLLHSKEFPEYRYRPRKKDRKAEEKVVVNRTSSGRVSKPRSRARKQVKCKPEALSDMTGPTTFTIKSEPFSPASPQAYPSSLSPITPTPTRPVSPGEEVTGQTSPCHMATPLTPVSLTPGSPITTTTANPASILIAGNSILGAAPTSTSYPSGQLPCGVSATNLVLSLAGGMDISQVSSFLTDTMSVIRSDIGGTTTTASRSVAQREPMDFMELDDGDVDVNLINLSDEFDENDVNEFSEYCDEICDIKRTLGDSLLV